MKVIKIECCDDCPYCSFYNGYHDRSNVLVCDSLDIVISDDIDCGEDIHPKCRLEEI